jgi:arylsulfatase A-like enzyme
VYAEEVDDERGASGDIGHHLPVHFDRTLVFVLWIVATIAPLSAQSRPNTLLFLVDDMGWQDTSVAFWSKRTKFNDHFRTPAMERLAAQGVRFTNAYSHSVCSPTRTSIMTGQNPVRHHVTNWTLTKGKDQSGKWGRVGPPKNWQKDGLQPSDATLAVLLRKAGYFTIHCGKAHWGAHGTKGSDPRNLGFDVNIAGHAAGGPGSYHGKTNFGNRKKGGRTLPWGIPGLEAYHGKDVHLTDACTAEAKKAVSRAVGAKKPFYLYMAHYAVHAPIRPHGRFMQSYRGRKYDKTEIDIPVAEQRYASMVEGMDASLQSLLDHFEMLGVAENTLVIFTSDNGGLSAHARGKSPRNTGANSHNWPLRAGKASAYEGGTRVPFLVCWAKPDAKAAVQKQLPLEVGSSSDQPLICEDLFPTLLGVAGAEIPKDRAIDGHDMRPYWLGEKSKPNRRLVFHYPHVWGPRGPGYEPHSAMREGRWKVIYFYNARRWELYDLETDISETHNLAESEPARLSKLAGTLQAEMSRLDAQWPVDRKTGEPEPLQMPPAK